MQLTVRTPAGASGVFTVEPALSAGGLTDLAVDHFAARDELEPGPFRLGLVRDRAILDLPPESSLGGQGVATGDVLHLITCEPQVDGGPRWHRW